MGADVRRQNRWSGVTSNKSGLKLSQCALNWKMKRQMVCLLSDRQEQLTSPSPCLCLCLCLFVFTNRSFLQTRLFLSFFPLALCWGGQACSSPFSSEEFQIYTSQLISHQGSSRHRLPCLVSGIVWSAISRRFCKLDIQKYNKFWLFIPLSSTACCTRRIFSY